jgi:hypothetical protein
MSDEPSTPEPEPSLPNPMNPETDLPDPMNTETRGAPLPDTLKRDSDSHSSGQ